jgi:hypothetical protein
MRVLNEAPPFLSIPRVSIAQEFTRAVMNGLASENKQLRQKRLALRSEEGCQRDIQSQFVV